MVAGSAAVGVPDAAAGEAIVLAVTLVPGAELSADDVLLLPATPPGAEGLRTVQVVAEAIDWTDIHRVVVELRYAAPATGFTTEEHLAFSADTSPVLEWQFIAPGDGPRVYQWEASYLAHDGRRFVRDGAATLDEALSLPPGTS